MSIDLGTDTTRRSGKGRRLRSPSGTRLPTPEDKKQTCLSVVAIWTLSMGATARCLIVKIADSMNIAALNDSLLAQCRQETSGVLSA